MLAAINRQPGLRMINRRTMMTSALAAFAGVASIRPASAQAGMSRITAYAFSFPALAGGDIRLAEHAGHPMLIVNTASLCGFTPQYAGLQQLWSEFGERAPVLQMGGGGAAKGCAALELPQIPRRSRRLYRRRIPGIRRAP
jgi:hypothetical protein